MTPEEVREILVSLRAVKRCSRCRQYLPVREFKSPDSVGCARCNAEHAKNSRARRQWQREHAGLLASALARYLAWA